MYAFLTTIMLLSSIWFGLDFADRLVTPIRDLIAATDEVSAGNLDVRVNVDKPHGELAHLGDVFNNMTTELNLQQNRLIEANRINDERREFTEAVLSGVPVAVMGVDSESVVTILNRSAEELSLADADGAGDRRRLGGVGLAGDRPDPEGRGGSLSARRSKPDHHQARRRRAHLECASHLGARRCGTSQLRRDARRHHRPRDGAAHLRLGGRRAAHRA